MSQGLNGRVAGVGATKFDVRVESAIVSEPGPKKDRVHFWIRIKSRETGKVVYVDDGFWVTKPERIHVHTERPCGDLYEFDLATRNDKPRENADPVTPHGANGYPYGRPPKGPTHFVDGSFIDANGNWKPGMGPK